MGWKGDTQQAQRLEAKRRVGRGSADGLADGVTKR